MGIKRGICWVLVIALLLPLFPVLSVSAVGDDGIVQEEAGSVVETEPEIVDNDASEAFPAEYDETADEDSECIVLEEKNNESSNEKNIGEETEETSEIPERLEIPQISELRLYDSYGEEIEILPKFSSECNAYTVTAQGDVLRLYATFSSNSSLRVDDFIVENTGVMNREIDLRNTLDLDTGLSHIALRLTYMDETSHEIVVRSIDITVNLEAEKVTGGDVYATTMEKNVASQLTDYTWLTDFSFTVKGSSSQADHPVIEFDPNTTAYNADITSSARLRTIYLTPSEEAVATGVCFQFLLDDLPVKSKTGADILPQKFTSTEALRATKYAFSLDSIPVGTTHVAKLLVGPLAEGATNLVESDCNVYSITINRTVGINELIVQDSDGSTATLAPAFHPQEKEYETEVKGEKIKVKTAWVEPIKTYVGNNTEPANSGTTGFAWTDVELADYTAKGSDVAIIPIRAEYVKDGTTYSNTYQLSVKWTRTQKVWLTDFSFTVKGSSSQADYPVIAFDPNTTAYNADITSSARLRTIYLTPSEEAVATGICFQFLLDDLPVKSTAGADILPQKFTSTEALRATKYAFSLDSIPVGTTHVAKLLVGPLAEGATNLVESDCNVYSITINRTVGINELIVQDSDGSTATLAPAFHPQEKEYETEVKGEKIKVKTAWVEPIKTYVGNNTEPANSGTTGFAWTDVELADYTAKGSDVAIIPIRAEYVKDGTTYSNTYQLSVKWTRTQKVWLTDFSFTVKGSSSQADHPVIEFDPNTTAYNADITSSARLRTIYLTPSEEAVATGVCFQFLLDDLPVKSKTGADILPQKFTSTEALRATKYAFSLDSIPVGTTHVAKLLVGPLAEGATNLVESDCNVYSITINRTVGINELIVQDSDGSTATLAPAFHPQEKEYETEVKGEKIKVKTAWVEPIKTYVGNNTEPANSGTTGFAWTDVELADYTAKGSDVAIIPIRAEYVKDGTTYSNTYQLSVKWTRTQKVWLTDFSFTVKGSSSQADYPVIAFDPNTTAYNADITSSARLRTIYLTPSEEAVATGICFQFLLDDLPVKSTAGADILPQKFTSTEALRATKYAFSLDSIPVGTTHVAKLLVGPLAEGATNLVESDCNVYSITINRTVGINELIVQDSDGSTATLAPAFHPQEKEYETEVKGEKIKVKTAWVEPIKTYVGNNTEPANSGTTGFAWTDVELADYTAKGSDVAIIPIRAEYVKDRTTYSNTYQLSVKWTDLSKKYTPVIKKVSEDVITEKNKKVELSVEIEPIDGDGTVSYQWYWRKWNYRPSGIWEDQKVDGATQATFTPPTTEAQTNMWYACQVSYTTADGKTYTTTSEFIRYTVNLGTPNDPIIIRQPGTFTMVNRTEILENTFKDTYNAGEYLDPIYIAVSYGETGTTRTYTWYCNNTDSNTGGTELSAKLPIGSNLKDGEFYGFNFNEPFEAGEYYLYCVIRDTNQQDETKYSEVRSGTKKITVKELNTDDFDGDGTEKNPFLLKTADDLLRLQKKVNKDGVPYTNMYFRIVADITLPENWTPIGCTKDGTLDIKKGLNLNPFSGTIDGDNHLLTVPTDGLPLLGYVRDATVKNLNIKGERIAGAGLVNNYTGPDLHGNAITIENVCLKNGTKTLKSGLVQGVFGGNQYSSATADFTVTIRNCTAEDGVVIGYTGTESRIGTFASKINGTIENCTSYATVKGKNYVGGLIGTMDNAMGKCTVRNSSFHGTVSGSNYVGGIIGGGYSNDNSAPNGGRPNLIGNTVDGTVTGGSCVGGITGGDQYVAQTRANVAHSVTGNTFTGTVSGSQYVGGIIGYYNSLNVYDNVAGNKYSGADKGVGYVKYIDTSYKNPKLMDGTVAFNTGKTTVGLPDVQWNTWKEGLNRDDDPLGVDAENLARKIGGSSQPTCIELTVSGNYKTEYDFGENLDLTGIILTASWDDGTTSTVSLDDVKISGYDKNKTGEQTVILTYGAAKAYITVRVTPKSSKITVNVSILGDKKHGSTSAPHGLARGGLTAWATETNVEADTAETVWDVLKRVAAKHNITLTADDNNKYGTVYISAVNGLGEFDNGKNSGWMYTVNGTHPEKGVSAKYLKNGDNIVLHYTDDYDYEEGGNKYGQKPSSGGGSTTPTTPTTPSTGGTSMITTADRNKAAAVDKLIEKIGNVTKDSGPAIEAARKAYNDLTPTQKRLVTKLKELTDAETAYAKLTATAEDQQKAKDVMDKISKIGNVTKDSEQDIKDARKAYDALTDMQKLLVDNYETLTAAETKFAMLDTLGKVSDPYINTGDYMEKLGTPNVGAIGGEWMVIGLARSGRTVPGVEDYYQKAVEYVQQSIDPDTGRLHKAKSTDNSRMILALTAIGKDVTNVGGYNLLAGLSDLEFVKYQGNNGPIWALLALDSGNYPVPSGGTTTRQALIDEILSVQTSDGGWAISGDRADSDMTGMALTALAPYYKKDPTVKQAIDKAIARLSEMQDADGGYSTTYGDGKYVATSESTAQVLTALSALGIDGDTDSRFVKNGSSVVDALLRYYVKGGGFKHIMDGEIDGMGTEQAYYALTAYYRFLSGKTNLYDMTDIIDMGGDVVTVEPTVPAATEPAQAAQTNIPWWIIAVCIFGGVGWGVVIGIVLVPKLNKKKD